MAPEAIITATNTGEETLALVADITERYRLDALRPLIESLRSFAGKDDLSVAVIGRFKAGKSSFLNHFFQRDLLPIGVVPVTTVITEICYGPREQALVQFLDGRVDTITIDRVAEFVAEANNPENQKHVSTVQIELPRLANLRGLRFVDMPGLESALAHNTEAALRWLPNVGLALVAVSVDPPLSQQDVELIKIVYDYTPNISVLLTKVDLISGPQRAEVIDFVKDRLTRVFGMAPDILPYSVRPGYERFRVDIDEGVVQRTISEFERQRSAVMNRKLATLVRECGAYLSLALKSAQAIDLEREALRKLIAQEQQALAETKSELRLIVDHAAAATRVAVAKRLEAHHAEIEHRLCANLATEFPQWTRSLRVALESFEMWLRATLSEELLRVSAVERVELLSPMTKVNEQVLRRLQDFRDRLSDRVERAFGITLQTTEAELAVAEPRTPDVYIGKVFDRNWELLSAIVPMALLKSIVRRHFKNRLPYMIEKNSSRLTSQWEDAIRAAMSELHKTAERRLNELISTVERMLSVSENKAPAIRRDLEALSGQLTAISDE